MTTLAPIEHRDAYTRAVDREIRAWFAEAIFAPIAIVLRDAGVPMQSKFQAIRFDEAGRENSADWIEFPREWGGLGLDRNELPQVPTTARGALTQFLEARGFTSTEEMIRADELKPAQSGYWQSKVEHAREHDSARAILVSADGYILDGHHQWAAVRLDTPDEPVRVIRFEGTITALIRNVRQLPSSFRSNATSALVDALQAGRVQYSDGVFSGRFSSAITRELRELGATFNAREGTFSLADANIPIDLRGVLAQSALRAASTTTAVLNVLDAIAGNLAVKDIGIVYTNVLDRIADDLGRQFVETTLTLDTSSIGLVPEISTATRKTLDEGFTRNLNLSIKDFASERIPDLRARVEENAFKFGGRTDRLAKIIEAEFGVTRRKAEFLADQETGLLVSKYRAAKYDQLGIKEYTWSTSRDVRVRPSHRRLEGKRFSFAVGANVSEPGKPARYCNPGEDFRCRCVPRPIINLEELAA